MDTLAIELLRLQSDRHAATRHPSPVAPQACAGRQPAAPGAWHQARVALAALLAATLGHD